MKPIFFGNCRYGLHGPIELLSRTATEFFKEDIDRCITGSPVVDFNEAGEDVFVDRCLLLLGVDKIENFDLLSEIACHENPSPCGGKKVSFHPFKTPELYFQCLEQAKEA